MAVTVYVAAKNMRGAWADWKHLPVGPTGAAPKLIDVTSAQAVTNDNRVDFSPMHMAGGVGRHVDADEGAFGSFEHYWQSLKKIDGLDHVERKQWWRSLNKPKRRDPKMINKNKSRKKVLHAEHKRFPGEQLTYVQSRQKIYVPDYHDRIKSGTGVERLKRELGFGRPLVIFDFDGPRADDGTPIVEEVTVEMLKRRIKEERFPFGHGYVVAATVLGIEPSEYCAM